MKISPKMLDEAVNRGIIEADQADALIDFLKSQPGVGARFDFTHILYYFGGLIAIGAMSLFMNLGWESFGGWGIFFISILYMGIGLKLSSFFQAKGYGAEAQTPNHLE